MKAAKIKSIYKNCDPSEAENYSSISIFLAISEVIEKLLHKGLLSFCNKHQLLSVQQNGFQPKKPCMGTTLKLREYLEEIKEENELAFAAFIEFRKAFDTVDHSILL